MPRADLRAEGDRELAERLLAERDVQTAIERLGTDPGARRQLLATATRLTREMAPDIHDMLDAAGGQDVFSDVKQQSVQATTELILARRPEVIVELRYGDNVKVADIPREMQAWSALSSLPAVKNHRVHALVGDEYVVPGPRVVEAVRRLATTIHPEVRLPK